MRAVLFDLDGTLVESEIDFEELRRRVAERLSVPPEILRPLYEGAEALGALDVVCEEEARRMELSGPVPGMRELVCELRRMGIAVGIVTRCCRKAALIALERCSIPYDVLVAAEDAPRVKPSPEHVLEALRRLGDVEKCVFVGDSLFDRVAAEGAGCAFLPTGRPDWLLKQIMRILFNSVSTNPP